MVCRNPSEHPTTFFFQYYGQGAEKAKWLVETHQNVQPFSWARCRRAVFCELWAFDPIFFLRRCNFRVFTHCAKPLKS